MASPLCTRSADASSSPSTRARDARTPASRGRTRNQILKATMSSRCRNNVGQTMVFFGLSMALCTSTLLAQPYSTWSDYGGSADSMQCSSLKQITKFNVAQLQQVWTSLVPGTQGRFGFNPLVTPTPPRQPPAVEPEGPVITINRFGKGIAIYCVPPIFTAYQQDGTPGRRCLIAWMLDQV